jgi:3-deoxy-manno-octulosonate cytidylyltransferase (CMP-KDO synthetase)
VEQHGENPRQNVYAIIPARLRSTRLAGKLVLDLAGKPLILRTVEQAKKAKNIDRVIVATDSEEILKIVRESGNEAVLTSENHQSGSDRIAEIAANLPENSIIVNVQGDEPLISPSTIEKAVEAILNDETADIATTCEKIEDFRDVLSSDVVKVVTDKNGYALYFSRAPIPFPREAVKKHGSLERALRAEKDLLALFRKHTGLYVYRREFLLKFTRLEQTNLEKTEMLEQLRALENGARIKVVEVSESSIGVDTAADFERVKRFIEAKENHSPEDSFNYRWANVADILQAAKVYVRTSQISYQGLLPNEFLNSLSEAKEEREFRKRLFDKKYQMFVAESSAGEIIGYADVEIIPYLPTGFNAKLSSIYVLPEFQRKGIGRELFNLVVSELKISGVNSLLLEALEISPFKSFYEKLGGELVGFSYHKLAEQDFKTLVYGWKDLSEFSAC